MNELDELSQLIRIGKKTVNQILSWLEFHKVEIPVILDLEHIREVFIFMNGFVDCLERYDITPKQNEKN